MNVMTPIDLIDARPLSLRDRFGLRPRWQRRAVAAVPLALAAALGATLLGAPEEAPPPAPAPVVTVAPPLVREIDEWESHLGRFAASRSVEVRPRVSGEVTGVHFRDGQLGRRVCAAGERRAQAAARYRALSAPAGSGRDNRRGARRISSDSAVSRQFARRRGAAHRALCRRPGRRCARRRGQHRASAGRPHRPRRSLVARTSRVAPMVATPHLEVSAPGGMDRDRLRAAAARCAERCRQYLLAEHRDIAHPHCHLVVKLRAADGACLDPRKADLVC